VHVTQIQKQRKWLAGPRKSNSSQIFYQTNCDEKTGNQIHEVLYSSASVGIYRSVLDSNYKGKKALSKGGAITCIKIPKNFYDRTIAPFSLRFSRSKLLTTGKY